MNKRMKKKVCCHDCGSRMRKFAIKLRLKDDYKICKVCHTKEQQMMREIMVEVGKKIPAIGAFLNVGVPWGII